MMSVTGAGPIHIRGIVVRPLRAQVGPLVADLSSLWQETRIHLTSGELKSSGVAILHT